MPEKADQTIARPNFFSDEFTKLIGEKLAGEIIDLICQNLTASPTSQRPTTLCLELIVFELDERILQELVFCAFHQINPVLVTQEIFAVLNIVSGNRGIEKDPKTPISKFELLLTVIKKLNYLQTILKDTCDLRETLFQEILLVPKNLPTEKLTDIYAVTDHVIIQQFRQALTVQYDNFALKLCNKVSCINSDLEFLASQIKQATINYPAVERGIIEMADAASNVALAFYSEEHDFDEIFEAVEETAKLIEDLASYYQFKLAQLEHYLSLSTTGCPTPINAPVNLPTIPTLPPPPPIFPIIGFPAIESAASLGTLTTQLTRPFSNLP